MGDSEISKQAPVKNYWFVGAAYGGKNDQSDRFITEGIWENNFSDKGLDEVNSIQVGDHIAIKAAYVRKNDLPFDNKKQHVSVMRIKAVGQVKKNSGDGHRLEVKWEQDRDAPREWYFYTNRSTVWKVSSGSSWKADALIDFAFNNKEQDIRRFRNAPYWRGRFGDESKAEKRFLWGEFYQAVATALLSHKDDRSSLINAIHKIVPGLQDQFSDGTKGPHRDICPFTTMGLFNKNMTNEHRKEIAVKLAEFLDVKESVPDSFEGIPILSSLRSWFFAYEKDRKLEDIDILWKCFEAVIKYADSPDEETHELFMKAYDKAIPVRMVKWNLTMGFYWIRPWNYLPLDVKSREYIRKTLGLEIKEKMINASNYLALIERLENSFQEDDYPVHSFPELSLAAYGGEEISEASAEDIEEEEASEEQRGAPYSIDNILDAGCFMKREDIAKILQRFRDKKNLILQGPPGTGKTWLAKRLAFALLGRSDEGKVRAVQFHPNLSYEDFVRGWRPSGEGKLSLVDGPFLKAIDAAQGDSDSDYVVVIEEINRGNPAQIFGEMLTLLEPDKRDKSNALELSYPRHDGELVWLPENLYVIGTMNLADRSLAIVDFALRRRFAFIDLEPQIGEKWRNWVHEHNGIDMAILRQIENRINDLNEKLAQDSSLGPQYKIGHSYITPSQTTSILNPIEWFRQIVETEICPLLREYWFDDVEKVKKAKDKLLENLND